MELAHACRIIHSLLLETGCSVLAKEQGAQELLVVAVLSKPVVLPHGFGSGPRKVEHGDVPLQGRKILSQWVRWQLGIVNSPLENPAGAQRLSLSK